jgi:hypothetical protein
VHILEDPFEVLLEEVSSPSVLDFLRLEIMNGILNELSKKLWTSKSKESKQRINCCHGCIGIMI